MLYASDYPYGQQPGSLLLALRTARIAGLDDAQQRAMLAGSARRIHNGEEPLPLSPPQGPESISQPLTFARIHAYLSMATPLLWMRQADTIGVLGLALNACDERSNGRREQTEQIRELIIAARDLWLALPDVDEATVRAPGAPPSGWCTSPTSSRSPPMPEPARQRPRLRVRHRTSGARSRTSSATTSA